MNDMVVVVEMGIVEVINNDYLKVLIFIILLDILTGIVKSAINGRLNSSIGLVGLLKHILIMVTNIFIVMFSPLFELETVATSLVLFFLVQYGISILENWISMGLPVPKFLYDMLKEKEDEMGGKM